MIKEENGCVYWTSNNYYYLGHEKIVLDNIVKIIVSYELMTIYIEGRETPYTVYWYFSPEECGDDYQRLKDVLRNRERVLKNIETDCGFGVYVKQKEEVDKIEYMKRVKSREGIDVKYKRSYANF